MRRILFLMFFNLVSVSLAYAAHGTTIELTDGSTLDGEVVSFSNGQYTINSPSLGILKIEDSKIRNIRHGEPTAEAPKGDVASVDSATVQSEMQKLQPAITGNPAIMKIIAGLISEPDFQAILKDPEIMSAAKNLDIKTLAANGKFVNAVNNPTVQAISEKIKEQKGSS